jgi:hypothetical protein
MSFEPNKARGLWILCLQSIKNWLDFKYADSDANKYVDWSNFNISLIIVSVTWHGIKINLIQEFLQRPRKSCCCQDRIQNPKKDAWMECFWDRYLLLLCRHWHIFWTELVSDVQTDYDSKTVAYLAKLVLPCQWLVESLVGDPNSPENSKNGSFVCVTQ